MTSREKAIVVLARTGQPALWAHALLESEVAELAAIHDEASDETLANLMAGFWARREERLAAAKATSSVEPDAPQTKPLADEAPNAEPVPITEP